MKLSSIILFDTIATAAILTGCGGSQGQIAPGPIQQNAPLVAHRNHGLPGSAAKAMPLVYIPTFTMNEVSVYSWRTGKPVQTLTKLRGPRGECTDNARNIWIASATTSRPRIVEYAHAGTKPTRSLNDRGAYPVGCAVDPTTGDLAVANASTAGGDPGNIAVFKHARGKPQAFVDSKITKVSYLTYDGQSDLFIEGTNKKSSVLYAELPKGSAAFQSVVLVKNIKYPSGLQWDGANLAVGGGTTIYRISGGKIIGTTRLTNAPCNNNFFIAGKQIAALCSASRTVSTFDYPAGGSSTHFFRLYNNPPFGMQFNLAISQ